MADGMTRGTIVRTTTSVGTTLGTIVRTTTIAGTAGMIPGSTILGTMIPGTTVAGTTAVGVIPGITITMAMVTAHIGATVVETGPTGPGSPQQAQRQEAESARPQGPPESEVLRWSGQEPERLPQEPQQLPGHRAWLRAEQDHRCPQWPGPQGPTPDIRSDPHLSEAVRAQALPPLTEPSVPQDLPELPTAVLLLDRQPIAGLLLLLQA